MQFYLFGISHKQFSMNAGEISRKLKFIAYEHNSPLNRKKNLELDTS